MIEHKNIPQNGAETAETLHYILTKRLSALSGEKLKTLENFVTFLEGQDSLKPLQLYSERDS